jgi:hypothetical protein
MNCTELERLLVSGASESEMRAHRDVCPSCAALGAELDGVSALVAGLRLPAASPAFRESLLSIPRKTVSCEGADALIAAALDGDLPPADRSRLEFHVSRCEACAESAGVLLGMRDLARPEPAPWLAGRIAASRPKRAERTRWRLLRTPQAAIGLAYAAAVVVMLAGFNPADLARKAGGRIEESARASVEVAGNSLADRVGAFQESAMRKVTALKGRVTGYGRAALSTAIALVMKSESKSPPSRPRSGEDKGSLQRDEIEIRTRRA